MGKTKQIAFMVEFEVNDGKEAELTAFLPTMTAAAEAEPGTLAYHCFRSSIPRNWFFYELFEDAEATITHMDNFNESISPVYTPLITPKRIVVCGDLNDELQTRLQPLIDGIVPGLDSVGYVPIEGYPS